MNRYDRHLRLPEFQNNGQEKLNLAKVLIVGAGGLGHPLISYLSAAGIGHIGIADFDQIELSNLHRQVLFHECDIGKSKAEVAGLRAKEINSQIMIEVFTQKITSENIEHIADPFEIIINATDNFATTYLLNDYCVLTKKHFIFAAIQKFNGLLASFHPGCGCYRCIFPDWPENFIGNCNELGVVGPLPGILGTMQALETIKIILNLPPLQKLLSFDFLTFQQTSISYQRSPFCEICGDSKKIKSLHPSNYQHAIPPEKWLKHHEAKFKSNAIWIDIREPNEFAQGSLAAAINKPLSTFIAEELDINKTYILFCATGTRCEKLWTKLNSSQNIFFCKDNINL